MELSGHLLSVLIFFPAFGALALLCCAATTTCGFAAFPLSSPSSNFFFRCCFCARSRSARHGYSLVEYKPGSPRRPSTITLAWTASACSW